MVFSLPRDGTQAFFIGLICTMFGAYSDWWWGGSRWKLLMVPDK